MNRLTEHDDHGNWCLSGVAWNLLKIGQVITKEIWEKLYGALWKLKDYEDTGLTPEDIMELKEFYSNPLNTAVPSIKCIMNEDGVLDIYDDAYDIVLHCASEEEQIKTFEMLHKRLWTPVQEQLPETDDYVLLSFANFSLLMIGRYERDEDGGGAWYVGDCDEEDTCISQNLFVNAWMPLPKPYREEDNAE